MRGAILSLLAFVCLAFAAEPTYEGSVAVLTTDTFDDWIANQDIALVEFYAPWCGHCKKLTPEYATAAERLKGRVALAKVDCTVETELQSRFGVSGYPTLKIFRSGSPSEYKGPRVADGIVSFMEKQARPAVTVFQTPEELDKFLVDDAAVVYFGKPEGKLYKTFEKFSSAQREAFRFGSTENQAILDKFGHNGEIVLLQSKRYTASPLETAKVVASAASESDLLKWVQSNILPFVGEYTEDNANLYKGLNKPLVKFYSDLDWKLNAKGANYLLNRIRKAAGEFKDKFSFVVSSKIKNAKELEDSGLKGDSPFGIVNDLGKKFPSLESFTPASLKKHLEDYLAEKLEAYTKSEPIPENQDPDQATVVVGKTFDQIVMDPTKDVLLEAYAPWCGHCKKLAPVYDELAAKMRKISDNVVIAKIDATANDIPSNVNVRGFPTIFYFPAGSKASPLTYEGGREVDDFVKYIKKTTKLPLTTGKKEDKKEEL